MALPTQGTGGQQDQYWPLPKFYFSVDIGSATDLPFQEVSGLEIDTDPIKYRHRHRHGHRVLITCGRSDAPPFFALLLFFACVPSDAPTSTDWSNSGSGALAHGEAHRQRRRVRQRGTETQSVRARVRAREGTRAPLRQPPLPAQ